MSDLKDVKQITVAGPRGEEFKCLASSGELYASVAAWARIFQVPPSLTVGLAARFESHCALMRADQDVKYQELLQATHAGSIVYHWLVALSVFRSIYMMVEKMVRASISDGIAAAHDNAGKRAFVRGFKHLELWISRTAGHVLAGKVGSAVAGGAELSAEVVRQLVLTQQQLAQLSVVHDGRLKDHDLVINEVREEVKVVKKEIPSLADPDGYVTVNTRLQERGIVATEMPRFPQSKRTWAQLVGADLSVSGAEKGASVWDRLPDSSKIVQVWTYRRAHIDASIERIRAGL